MNHKYNLEDYQIKKCYKETRTLKWIRKHIEKGLLKRYQTSKTGMGHWSGAKFPKRYCGGKICANGIYNKLKQRKRQKIQTHKTYRKNLRKEILEF